MSIPSALIQLTDSRQVKALCCSGSKMLIWMVCPIQMKMSTAMELLMAVKIVTRTGCGMWAKSILITLHVWWSKLPPLVTRRLTAQALAMKSQLVMI